MGVFVREPLVVFWIRNFYYQTCATSLSGVQWVAVRSQNNWVWMDNCNWWYPRSDEDSWRIVALVSPNYHRIYPALIKQTFTIKFDRSIKNASKGIDRGSILLVLKNQREMAAVFVFVCTGNENVISIQGRETETRRHLIHELLEGLSPISQAKRFTKEFI